MPVAILKQMAEAAEEDRKDREEWQGLPDYEPEIAYIQWPEDNEKDED